MKRFWDGAAVESSGDEFRVLLDSRPARLLGGTVLAVPRRALAEAIAAEWNAAGGGKGGDMDWTDVPLTRLAGTAQECIAPDPEPVALEIARYGETDLLCYRADGPEALARRQSEQWDPWLNWAASRYGAKLRVTTGLMHVSQDPPAVAALAQAVAAQTPAALAALAVAVPALGSLVLGLAMAEFRLDGEAAFVLASVDERFQAERWGCDDAAEQRRRRTADEVVVAGRFLRLVR